MDESGSTVTTVNTNVGSSRKIEVSTNRGYVFIYNTFFETVNAVNISEILLRESLRSNMEVFGYKFKYVDDLKPNDDSITKEVVSKEYKNVPGYLVSECGLVKVKSGRWTRGRKDRGARRLEVLGKKDYIHLVMARTFLGRHDDMVLEHKDGDKTNNLLSNIHYVTKSNKRKSSVRNYEHMTKDVIQMNSIGIVLNIFPSMRAASKTLGCSIAAVSKCCNMNLALGGKKPRTCKGFRLCFDV